MKALFMLFGLALAGGAAWTFVRPLWREGQRVMALFVGLFVAALVVGLTYFLLG